MNRRRVDIPGDVDLTITTWGFLLGLVVGFAIASLIFTARTERRERELAVLRPDPTGSRD